MSRTNKADATEAGIPVFKRSVCMGISIAHTGGAHRRTILEGGRRMIINGIIHDDFIYC
jgi:hypothetical protein